MTEITHILQQAEYGNPVASAQLLPLVYEELRRLAARRMSEERVEHTLQPTALVHEAWLRLVGDGQSLLWSSRGHFYAAAAEAMRRILIESARRKSSLKRGGEVRRVELPEESAESAPDFDCASLLSLDDALAKLKSIDIEGYQLVMLRFYGGLTIEEAAKSLDISPRTAKRNWSYARAWLQREMDGPAVSEPR